MAQIEKKYTEDCFISTYLVEKGHSGLRLDQFIKRHLQTLSREFIKKKIGRGEIVIENRHRPHRSSCKVHRGEKVSLFIKRPKNLDEFEGEYWLGQKINIESNPEVIYQNDKILVISKPPFMATHPTGRHFFNTATTYFEQILKKTIHSIHRLDRETSGLLILGKEPQASREITNYFEAGKVNKCYFLIASKQQDVSFPLKATQRIGHIDPKQTVFLRSYPSHSSQGKEAQTIFHYLGESKNHLLLLAFPKTGRQHQIRVHAASNGFPILGDKIYGPDRTIFMRYKDRKMKLEDYEKLNFYRHALHAYAINLSEINQTWVAPIPSDLHDFMKKNLEIDFHPLKSKIENLIYDNFLN